MSRPPAVLCIDDNVLGLSLRKAMLESRDFQVFTAENGRSGLEIADREQIDVVILDYKMPGMDGGSVAKELRRRHPEVPILLFSGFAGQIPPSLLRTVDSFVTKGASPTMLMEELERILSENRQRPGARARIPENGRLRAIESQDLFSRPTHRVRRRQKPRR